MKFEATALTVPRSRSTPRERSKRVAGLFRVVRRVHLYLGLWLLPWLCFYGLSGVLFNHPGLFESVQARRLAADDFAQSVAWSAPRAAQSVVSALNGAQPQTSTGERYRLDPSYAPRFAGYTMLTAPAPDGRYTLFVHIERGVGVLVHRTPPQPVSTRFERLQLELPELSTAAVERAASGLLQRQGLPVLAELRADPKVSPTLRLRVLDEQDQAWNLEYDSYSGAVTGRLQATPPTLGIAQLFSTLHTTHHFPLRPGPLLVWALFQDLLGAAMVLWSLTGIVMWWQLKPVRLLGGFALSAAVLVASWVAYATAGDVLFGDVPAQLGPGE